MGEKAKIKIGVMTGDDLDQVLMIEQASFNMPWSRQLFLRELHNPAISTLLVALADTEDARRVTGYVVFWAVADEMHILNLAVAPPERRRGTARKLVLAAIKDAYSKGARIAFLEVRASNVAAQKLYSGLGFTGMSVRRGYYDNPVEDAVIMMLGPAALKTLV